MRSWAHARGTCCTCTDGSRRRGRCTRMQIMLLWPSTTCSCDKGATATSYLRTAGALPATRKAYPQDKTDLQPRLCVLQRPPGPRMAASVCAGNRRVRLRLKRRQLSLRVAGVWWTACRGGGTGALIIRKAVRCSSRRNVRQSRAVKSGDSIKNISDENPAARALIGASQPTQKIIVCRMPLRLQHFSGLCRGSRADTPSFDVNLA